VRQCKDRGDPGRGTVAKLNQFHVFAPTLGDAAAINGDPSGRCKKGGR
jgi:hypothetical protein